MRNVQQRAGSFNTSVATDLYRSSCRASLPMRSFKMTGGTMNMYKRTPIAVFENVALPVLLAATTMLSVACGHLAMMGGGAQRPAADAFGLGPRTSEHRTYTATLQPKEPLAVRRLQTVPVTIVDAKGRPVEGASIAIDGRMPEHRTRAADAAADQARAGQRHVRDRGRPLQHGRLVGAQARDRTRRPAADRVTFNLSL
jgi:hypothetical protein